jgi:hypothetical protein
MPDRGQSVCRPETITHDRPSWDQRRWQTCPVCFGKGIVPNGFYTVPGIQWPSNSTTPEQCRSCGGKGIVR